jgi:polyene glycosyltransferase
MAALLVAVRQLGPEHKFLWKLSKSQQELLPPTSLPDNLRVESWIPSQLGVLAHPHVRAFVTHGGANGFHESIYYGKPVLVMPAWLDCYAIARRAIDSGVGLAIDRPATVTGDEVATKIMRILTEDSFRQRAEYWAQSLREAGGVARAADLILELKAELS